MKCVSDAGRFGVHPVDSDHAPVSVYVQGARRLLTRSGDDVHAKAGAKTGGDLVIVRTQ